MERLRKLRKEKGLTTTELGQIIGCSNPTITNYERGYRKPDPETLIKFAKFFGVSVDYLLGLDEPTQSKSATPAAQTAYYHAPKEGELLNIYRSLPPELQDAVLSVARTFAGQSGESEQPQKTNLQKKA